MLLLPFLLPFYADDSLGLFEIDSDHIAICISVSSQLQTLATKVNLTKSLWVQKPAKRRVLSFNKVSRESMVNNMKSCSYYSVVSAFQKAVINNFKIIKGKKNKKSAK